MKNAPLISGTKQLLFNILLEDTVSAIRQDKGIMILILERKKDFLFMDNMTIYTENPVESINKLLKLISMFIRYKVIL